MYIYRKCIYIESAHVKRMLRAHKLCTCQKDWRRGEGRVAVCCSDLQCMLVQMSRALPRGGGGMLQCAAVVSSIVKKTCKEEEACCCVLQCAAVCCSVS